jgi:hypothetical protein
MEGTPDRNCKASRAEARPSPSRVISYWGLWTPFLTWSGYGNLVTKTGTHLLYISLSPSSHFSRLHIEGMRPTEGVKGNVVAVYGTGPPVLIPQPKNPVSFVETLGSNGLGEIRRVATQLFIPARATKESKRAGPAGPS